jgi:hypothetical protein
MNTSMLCHWQTFGLAEAMCGTYSGDRWACGVCLFLQYAELISMDHYICRVCRGNVQILRPGGVIFFFCHRWRNAEPDFYFQCPVDQTSSTNLDHPVHLLAAHALLNIDLPVCLPLDLTDMKYISLEPQVSPPLNLEFPTIPTLSLNHPGCKHPPINFYFPLRQPAAAQDIQKLMPQKKDYSARELQQRHFKKMLCST